MCMNKIFIPEDEIGCTYKVDSSQDPNDENLYLFRKLEDGETGKDKMMKFDGWLLISVIDSIEEAEKRVNNYWQAVKKLYSKMNE